jgi:hydroxypyruvate reductase
MTVLAIGKAAPAMCMGAADSLGPIDGLCVTNHAGAVPEGIEIVIGDHPVPSRSSLKAGERALELAPRADIALISGGGSALCEVPAAGLSLPFLAGVHQKLLESGAGIRDINLVRSHLSLIKGGGLGPIDTYILSDVAGEAPEVVSSGPTIGRPSDPERVLEILRSIGVEIDAGVEAAVTTNGRERFAPDVVAVIGDGRTAAQAAVSAVDPALPSRIGDGWIEGDLQSALSDFIRNAPPGVTVAAGEPSVQVEGSGRGGRNTHAALTAAGMIAGTGILFAALATDGLDGSSSSAGAIVDGGTWRRGERPTDALARFDSATYLRETGDLVKTGPTGTNVADLWLIWKPRDGSEPILTS